MAQISRLRSAEIADGNLIAADDIGAELDQLVSESNSQDTRISAVETNTFTSQKTFNAGLRTDTIDEKTAAAGVTVDSVLLKDGMVTLAGLPTVDGQIGVDNNLVKARLNGTVRTVVTLDTVGLPKGYINGKAPTYTSTSSVTFPARLKARDSTNTADIELAGNVTVSLASSGAAGLDTGSEASNTWYYFYLIKKSSDGTTSVVASTTDESVTGSITMPSGYDLKRQLSFAVRNDGSSNIIPFSVGPGWPYRPIIRLRVELSRYATAGGVTTFQNGSASASWTTHNLSAYMPPCSREVFVQAVNASVSSTFLNLGFRPLGSSVAQGELVLGGDSTTATNGVVTTNSSQQIEIAKVYGTASSFVDVMGYTITEIN